MYVMDRRAAEARSAGNALAKDIVKRITVVLDMTGEYLLLPAGKTDALWDMRWKGPNGSCLVKAAD